MQFTRRLAWMVAGVALALVHYGCGGNNGGAATADLSGTIQTDRFEVPAGQTQQVSGDTTVHSTGDIVVAGDLAVANDASLSLIADGNLIISGNVTSPDEPEPEGGDEARAVTRQGEPKLVVLSGSTVTLGPTLQDPSTRIGAPLSSDLLIAVEDQGVVNIRDTALAGGTGKRGTTAAEPGTETGAQGGGNVEIGTVRANDAARAAGASGAGRPAAINVAVGATIRAGAGGWGFSSTGRFEGRNRIMEAGDGAPGGDVILRADAIEVTAALDVAENAPVRGGQGGDGGDCRGAAINGRPNVLFGDNTVGGDARFTTGHGGMGGTVTLDGAVDSGSSGKFQSGDGGRAGDANVTAGDGGDGLSGGNSSGLLGRGGAPGVVDGNLIPGTAGRLGVIVIGGGNGGTAASNQQNGGNGGFISLVNRDNAPAEGQLTIRDACSGGDGFFGCLQQTNGTDGGNVNPVPLFEPASLRMGNLVLGLVENSFNGGDGGDGTPPGNGGRFGEDEQGQPLGVSGNNGAPCPTDGGGGGGDGGGDQGGSVVEQEPNGDCSTATPMGNATTGLGEGNGANDQDAFKKEGLTIGKYRVTTTIAMSLDIVAGQFQSLNFPVTENGFADISIRDLPGSICFRIDRITPDETYSFSIEKLSDDPDADVPPP